MGNNSSNNVGTKVSIPGITKSVKNFKDSVTDYDYKVTVRGNKGTVEQVRFHRNTLAFIRATVKNIVLNGFSSNIFGKTFNKNYKFMAINLSKPGFNKVDLKDIDVYLVNENTKERFHFNMSNVFKMKGLAFSSTGIRTNQNHKKTSQNIVNKNHNQRFKNNTEMTSEQKIEKRREYARKHYLKNRERILEQKKEYNAKNRERRTAYNREWRKKNREHVNAYSRALYHKNPSKRHEYYARYYAKKKAQNIS